jgi:putative transposase
MYRFGSGFRNFIIKRHHQPAKKQVSEYIVDETILKVGSEFIWLWVAIEPENKEILAQDITKERHCFVA